MISRSPSPVAPTNQLDALDDALADSRFVRKTDVISYDNNYAQMSVQYEGSVNTLAREMEAAKGVQVKVENMTRRTIRAHMKR